MYKSVHDFITNINVLIMNPNIANATVNLLNTKNSLKH